MRCPCIGCSLRSVTEDENGKPHSCHEHCPKDNESPPMGYKAFRKELDRINKKKEMERHYKSISVSKIRESNLRKFGRPKL